MIVVWLHVTEQKIELEDPVKESVIVYISNKESFCKMFLTKKSKMNNWGEWSIFD